MKLSHSSTPAVRVLCRALCAALLAAALLPGTARADETKKDPVVTKEVWENGTSSWLKRTDTCTGIPVRFRLTGTLPHDIYEGYVYRFEDELPEGMTADPASVKVTLKHGEAEIPVELDVSTEGKTLLVGTDDLHAKAPDAVPGDSLVVEYTATLDAASCEYGLDGGNENMVHLVFSQHDLLGNTGLSLADSVRVHSYQLRVRMVEAETGAVLPGATLALADQDGHFLTTAGTWVDQQGDDTSFVTDEKGEVTFGGIDAGTYLVHEVVAPEGMVPNERPIGVGLKSEGIDGTSVQLSSMTNDAAVSTESVDPGSGLVVVVDERNVSEATKEEKEQEEKAERMLPPYLPYVLGAGAVCAIIGIIITVRE